MCCGEKSKRMGAKGQFYIVAREHFLIAQYLSRKLKEVKEEVVKNSEANVLGRGKTSVKTLSVEYGWHCDRSRG